MGVTQHSSSEVNPVEFPLCEPAVSESCLWFMNINIGKIIVMTEIQSRLSVAFIMGIKKGKENVEKAS